MEHHIKHIGTTHESYLQDTPDFLRTIQEINRVHTLGPNTMLVSMDAIGLYTNIPHEEGLEEMEIGLNKRLNQKVPTDFLVKMMEIILKQARAKPEEDATLFTACCLLLMLTVDVEC